MITKKPKIKLYCDNPACLTKIGVDRYLEEIEIKFLRNNKVSKAISKFINKFDDVRGCPFPPIERELSKGIASRRALFGMVCRMENAGVVVSETIKVPHHNKHTQSWLKFYKTK